jgi:hypothetical protein
MSAQSDPESGADWDEARMVTSIKKIGCQSGQLVILPLCPAEFDHHVVTFGMANATQTFARDAS